MNGEQCTGQPAREPEVERILNRTADMLSALEGKIGDLMKRLAVVSRDEPAKDIETGEKKAVPSCALAARIDDIKERLEKQIKRVMHQIVLLEI